MNQNTTPDTRQLESALVIGRTSFAGRHTVQKLLDHDYDVTALSRGISGYRLPDRLPVDHLTADRTDADVLANAAGQVDPDLVVDWAGLYPGDVRTVL